MEDIDRKMYTAWPGLMIIQKVTTNAGVIPGTLAHKSLWFTLSPLILITLWKEIYNLQFVNEKIKAWIDQMICLRCMM